MVKMRLTGAVEQSKFSVVMVGFLVLLYFPRFQLFQCDLKLTK